MMEDEAAQALAQHAMEPISRPNSTSTSASAAVAQLPGIASLAASNGANGSSQHAYDVTYDGHDASQLCAEPIMDGDASHTNHEMQQPSQPQQQQQLQPPQIPIYNGASPAATTGGNGNNLPTCQNCQTSTTPLWRRDEFGSVLCNACGLFLKLHGRARPISLKTDVIKSRNRVKTMRTDMQPKKKTPAQTNQGPRQKNGIDGESPISRTGTPSMYNQSMPSFMVDDPYQSTSFGAGDGRSGSPMNGDRNMDTPPTHEQLIASNSSLKTRVSELDLINELFRGRLSQLEQQEAAARRAQEIAINEHLQIQQQLEDSHRRENSLKRRLDELELELSLLKEETKANLAAAEESERPAKRARVASEQPDALLEETPASPPVDVPDTTEEVLAEPNADDAILRLEAAT